LKPSQFSCTLGEGRAEVAFKVNPISVDTFQFETEYENSEIATLA
jgi:hypothetical protein